MWTSLGGEETKRSLEGWEGWRERWNGRKVLDDGRGRCEDVIVGRDRGGGEVRGDGESRVAGAFITVPFEVC